MLFSLYRGSSLWHKLHLVTFVLQELIERLVRTHVSQSSMLKLGTSPLMPKISYFASPEVLSTVYP